MLRCAALRCAALRCAGLRCAALRWAALRCAMKRTELLLLCYMRHLRARAPVRGQPGSDPPGREADHGARGGDAGGGAELREHTINKYMNK